MKEFKFDPGGWAIENSDPVTVIYKAMHYLEKNELCNAYRCLSNFYNVDLVTKDRTNTIVNAANDFFNNKENN